ncbi:right-handed parallel beta-helix repeat-containing protein [Nanoarchaeota archaeon]
MRQGLEINCNDRRYVVKDYIADGAFGTVWKATSDSGLVVAVKFLKLAEGMGPDVAGKFEAESRKLAKFDHPHVVSVQGVGSDCSEGRKVPYYMMELLDKNLAEVLKKGEPLPLHKAAGILLQMGAGLEYAYLNGVRAHADIHPGNVLLDRNLDAKLADFGMMLLEPDVLKNLPLSAKTIDPTIGEKDRLVSVYAAPELRIGGRASSTPLSDMYSLGRIGFDILSLCAKDAQKDKMFAEAMSLITRAASLDRSERPKNLSDFLDDLELTIKKGASRVVTRKRLEKFGLYDLFEAVDAGDSIGSQVSFRSDIERKRNKVPASLVPSIDEYRSRISAQGENLEGRLSCVSDYVTLEKGAYYVDFDIVIKRRGTLELKPGVVLRFGKDGGIISEGKLLAAGNEDEHITFKAMHPEVNWNNITLRGAGASGSRLVYCDISGGGGKGVLKHHITGKDERYLKEIKELTPYMKEILEEIEELFKDGEPTPDKIENSGFDADYLSLDMVRNLVKSLKDEKARYAVGGGVLIMGCTPLLRHCSMTENHAEYGGGLAVLGVESPFISYNVISGNSASKGGGVYLQDCNLLDVQNLIVSGNISDDGGGGVYITKCTQLRISNSKIRENKANYGGGLALSDSKIVLESDISGNTSDGEGGGVYAKRSGLVAKGCEISENSSKGPGGGVYLGSCHGQDPEQLSRFYKMSIKGNTAGGEGGGVHCWDSRLSLEESRVDGNEARHGGGLFIYKSDGVTISGLESENNKASCGGSIALIQSRATVARSRITNNQADKGGGIFCAGNIVEGYKLDRVECEIKKNKGGNVFNRRWYHRRWYNLGKRRD